MIQRDLVRYNFFITAMIFPTVLYMGKDFHNKNVYSFGCDLVCEGLNSCYCFFFPVSWHVRYLTTWNWLSSAYTATLFKDIYLYIVAICDTTL